MWNKKYYQMNLSAEELLKIVPVHDFRAYKESTGVTVLILNLRTGWR